jgi:peptidoglycan hydrolase-like protein with peptidoglycan-binding domain
MTARVRLGALAIIATAAAAAPVSAATYGSRTMREGTSGKDVKQLQRYLTTVGFSTTADGAFGPRTARSVRKFERSDGRPVNGVVPPKDARVIERAATKAESEQAEPVEETTTTETSNAYITNDGLAVAPADAPDAVKQVIAAGNEIAKKPYRYGGGHGDWNDSGYDCSGSVSYALHGAGLVGRPLDSGEFMDWRFSGRGEWITVYAHGGHVYLKVAGLRFDTSGLDDDGTRWHDTRASREGYAVRHPRGL